MLIKPRRQIGTADVSDLSRNPIIKWQHKWYLYLIVFMGFGLPTLVAGLGWNDWKGGFFFAGAARLCFVHHVSLPSSHQLVLKLTFFASFFPFLSVDLLC
jgi:stearoyl-CoA desaturase (delta-9 desaturase)